MSTHQLIKVIFFSNKYSRLLNEAQHRGLLCPANPSMRSRTLAICVFNMCVCCGRIRYASDCFRYFFLWLIHHHNWHLWRYNRCLLINCYRSNVRKGGEWVSWHVIYPSAIPCALYHRRIMYLFAPHAYALLKSYIDLIDNNTYIMEYDRAEGQCVHSLTVCDVFSLVLQSCRHR